MGNLSFECRGLGSEEARVKKGRNTACICDLTEGSVEYLHFTVFMKGVVVLSIGVVTIAVSILLAIVQ